ncbi:MAG: Probable protease htpX homolog [uncultured Campylobacterales bacterium]|uniref:Probable protease htpX homolog n=1 Tax=uncultured Campylobacterales bacterium TaxID=352960 RepID=A0A6S6S4Y9_9BACT|nr:MAG: Probable protease htpX homolog [uncultured Campylobacterales bacterium]
MSYKDIIRKNRKKTKIVLAIYIFIYCCIGLLLDVIILNQGTLSESLKMLINFEVTPIATLIMLGVAIISIYISTKFFHKVLLKGDEYIEVNAKSTDYTAKQIYNIVEELCVAGGIQKIPKVYIVNADYMNAFASGWGDNSLVAITTGLINKLNREEIQAVMAHEITHVRNEDIKLTLVVGVLTNIMLFVVNNIVYFFMRGSRSKGAQNAKMILLLLQFILPIITIMLQMYLSRSREYMADSGAVELIRNPDAMASALRKISGDYEKNDYPNDNNKARKAAYIFVKGDSIFSTHPNVKNRIKALLGESAPYDFLKN